MHDLYLYSRTNEKALFIPNITSVKALELGQKWISHPNKNRDYCMVKLGATVTKDYTSIVEISVDEFDKYDEEFE